MSDSDDDVPQLSASTLAALQEFYAETNQGLGKQVRPEDKFSVGAVEEDWHLSQFWYTDETSSRLAEEVRQAAGEGGRIACLSAPSVYQKLKQQDENTPATLLEFDRRFSIYGDEFVFYDYRDPLRLPENVAPQSFDVVIADPPYLSQECLSQVALTVKFLTKGKVLLCTGAIMQEDAERLLGLKMCAFLPRHTHNLENEFRCYVNYRSGLDS